MEVAQTGLEREKSTPSSASPVSVVANFWKEFDLEKEKSILDEQGLRIAENQENSQKNRRKLAESTRGFKKASAEEKLNLFNSLLKGYQEEVDNLTKRAKFGENAFLNIYQKLYEAPDPFPALASIADQDVKISELESENRKMKVELEEFRAEAAHLKNQQATIRRLEERNRQLEQQMEEKVKEIVEMKQRSLAEENQKTMEVLKEREQSLQDQLRQAKESVATMQKLHELAQSQLFELRTQSEEDTATKQSELSLLMDEVERAQSRLLSLEREKGHLRSQLQSANEESDAKKSDSVDPNSVLENSLSAKEKIISDLNMELHKVETTLSNEREMHISEVKKLNALLHGKETALEELKKELHIRPTAKMVEDLRKKVKILQGNIRWVVNKQPRFTLPDPRTRFKPNQVHYLFLENEEGAAQQQQPQQPLVAHVYHRRGQRPQEPPASDPEALALHLERLEFQQQTLNSRFDLFQSDFQRSMFPIYDDFARQGIIQPTDQHPSWFHYPQGGYSMPGTAGAFRPVHYDPVPCMGGRHFDGGQSSHQSATHPGAGDDDDNDDDDDGERVDLSP